MEWARVAAWSARFRCVDAPVAFHALKIVIPILEVLLQRIGGLWGGRTGRAFCWCVGRVGGVVCSVGSKRVGSVEAEADVVVVCLRGGSIEFRCQLEVRAGSSAELSWVR